SRLLEAWRVMTAIVAGIACCAARSRSIVTNTSYFPAARTRSSPFRTPAQPHSGTVETSCPFSSLASRRGKHSSSRTRTIHQRFACVLERCDGLISGYRGKVFDKIHAPIGGFALIEQHMH